MCVTPAVLYLESCYRYSCGSRLQCRTAPIEQKHFYRSRETDLVVGVGRDTNDLLWYKTMAPPSHGKTHSKTGQLS